MALATALNDPLKSLKGMWNGSLIRLANYFKDPASYGQQTQTVLREAAKKYQDALDDCEIQILEAKWYLEHQLAINRARRAQQASESVQTANKRKLDFVNNEQHGNAEKTEENPPKRIKVQDTKAGDALMMEDTDAQLEDAAAVANDKSQNPNINDEPPKKSAEAAKERVQGAERTEEVPECGQPTTTMPKKPPDSNAANDANPICTEFTSQDELKTSGPATSIDENQGFNFDSMFDDQNDGRDGSNADLSFDMDLSTDAFASVINDQNNSAQADKSTSLNSLLQDQENYANNSGDDMMMNFNSSNTGGTGLDGAAGASSNVFDLPDLGDSNFDDLLNDDNLDGGIGGMGDDMLNDDSMMNLGEFDDSFFN